MTPLEFIKSKFNFPEGSSYSLPEISAIQCAAWMKEYNELQSAWISVEDRLPDYPVNELCLAVNAMGIIDKVRHYGGKRFIDHDGNDFYAIYWQPLPSPPNTK